MTLIAIILALLAERALSYSPYWRTHDLTGRWMRWVDMRCRLTTWSLALYLFPLLLPIILMVAALSDHLAGDLLLLPLSALVLLASLGPRDLGEELATYRRELERGHAAAAAELLQDLLAGPNRVRPDAAGRSPVKALFVQGHERWFAVLIWFFVLGPVGGAAYSIVAAIDAHLRRDQANAEIQALSNLLHGAMAWPSARLTGLIYALAGSADEALTELKARILPSDERSWTADAWPLLAEVGSASLRREFEDTQPSQLACMDAALGLIGRALILLLAIFALFTLGGWLA